MRINKVMALNSEHFSNSHNRWIANRNKRTPPLPENVSDDNPPDFAEEMDWPQCGECAFYVPLTGHFAGSWGVCSNPNSQFDRTAMFEHDGCDEFLAAGCWITNVIP